MATISLKGNKPASRQDITTLQVHATPWRTVGSVAEFPINEPQLLMVDGIAAKGAGQCPLYVLHSRRGFRVFNMERGGEHEVRVYRDQVMIRRWLPEQRSATGQHQNADQV